jgi:hypothetical protein
VPDDHGSGDRLWAAIRGMPERELWAVLVARVHAASDFDF